VQLPPLLGALRDFRVRGIGMGRSMVSAAARSSRPATDAPAASAASVTAYAIPGCPQASAADPTASANPTSTTANRGGTEACRQPPYSSTPPQTTATVKATAIDTDVKLSPPARVAVRVIARCRPTVTTTIRSSRRPSGVRSVGDAR